MANLIRKQRWIPVRAKHIREHFDSRFNGFECPLHEAFTVAGYADVNVGIDDILIRGHWYKMAAAVKRFYQTKLLGVKELPGKYYPPTPNHTPPPPFELLVDHERKMIVDFRMIRPKR